MLVTLLGTGTSHGVPVLGCVCPTCCSGDFRDIRYRSSALVEVDGVRILIDTATEFRLQALKNHLTRIDGVLLTHPHSDHICGFDDLRRFNELQQTTIPVFGSPATLNHIRSMFAYIFNDQTAAGGGKPLVTLHPIVAPFEIKGIPITPIPAEHGYMTVYGYRIGNVAYLTDCKRIPEQSLQQLLGLEVLILGVLRFRLHATHFNLEEGLDVIRRLNPKRTVLTHLSHDFKHNDSVNFLPLGVELGFDGLQIEVR